MAQTYEILGQIAPSANTPTNVFVTGASSSAIDSSVKVTFRDHSVILDAEVQTSHPCNNPIINASY